MDSCPDFSMRCGVPQTCTSLLGQVELMVWLCIETFCHMEDLLDNDHILRNLRVGTEGHKKGMEGLIPDFGSFIMHLGLEHMHKTVCEQQYKLVCE